MSKEASSVEDTEARSAMKLALEALNVCEVDGYIPVRNTRDAIKALEEALDKQEQGEPVAWIEHEWGGTGLRKLHFERHEPTVRDEVVNPIWTPLYTTPQQRPSRSDIKPLTDEQIETIRQQPQHHKGEFDYEFDELSFARAIEAAHGIRPLDFKE